MSMSIFKTPALETEAYYVDKVSSAMKADTKFMAQLHDCCMFLKNYVTQINTLNAALASLLYDVIIDDNIAITAYEYDDLLDKIASIFNLPRHITIDFVDPFTNQKDESMEDAFEDFEQAIAQHTLKRNLDLSNTQLRMLIFCQIMKNSYDGSCIMAEKTYTTLSKILSSDPKNATIQNMGSWEFFQFSLPDAGNAKNIFNYIDYDFSDDEVNQYFTLFFAGLLSIHAAGIRYDYTALDMTNILIWANDNATSADTQTLWAADTNNKQVWL